MSLDERDLITNVYRTAGGPGADNEIRVQITHRPTGVSVTKSGRTKAGASQLQLRLDAIEELTQTVEGNPK